MIILLQAWNQTEKRPDYTNTNDYGHYVVAVGYDKKRIYFEDPAVFSTVYLTYKEFEKRWHADDVETLYNFAIAVYGKKKFNFNKPIRME